MTDAIRFLIAALIVCTSAGWLYAVYMIDKLKTKLRLKTDINQLAKEQFTWVEEMGWHNKTALEALALISSEVGEAVNECRGHQPTDKLGAELADIILRTLDLAEMEGIDIGREIQDKMALNRKNGTRGRRI
jgi:NTP pyrophosphatase (non-canonical NTP hydrolase)